MQTIKRKRRVKKSVKVFAIVACLLVIVFTAITVVSFFYKNIVFWGEESVNADAGKYMTNTCLAYYPEGTKKGKQVARDLCRDVDEKTIFDYSSEKMGDYTVYRYSNGTSFVTDANGNDPKLNENITERGQAIISDYLRYTMKSMELDYAYTVAFLDDTYKDTITKDRYTYTLDGEYFVCHFDEYEVDVKIPLSVIGAELGMDVGEVKEYQKPVYVSKNRPAIALTFDDGPSLDDECTTKLLDELYRYDAQATFFCVGRSLGPKTKLIIQDGIEKGMQYGSHTVSHPNLKRLSDTDTIYHEVMDISTWFEEELNYTMSVYRPPEGAYNSTVDATVPLPAILWDIDTEDWKSRDPDAIYKETFKDLFDHAVILMHDIHKTTVEACVDKGIIRDLIDAGYQLVDIDTIAQLRGVELKQGTHLCWGD